ncbi:HAD family hydrolase [Lysobacter sp. TY2-98]|uniref:cation-translocating P-type ATPase n=1 Tax=Lysobacter sp. TY2-98 TaxID=2290922 RepID=UPI000E1FE0E4|nr:HAD-IC family P-type ATPase [Lysobacter sp. TY2-98]AXK71043.1 HAD family hydrolase [Lysobacter sp. TY2-98]
MSITQRPSPPLVTSSPAQSRSGLSTVEAAQRRARDGANVIEAHQSRPLATAIRAAVGEPMLLVLMAAVAIYALLGAAGDAAVLAVSVVLVVALTVYQSWRAERAVSALQELAAFEAVVRRDGRVMKIPARDVVVGDLVEVAEGTRIAADGTLLHAVDLQVDESLLTGESAPVSKTAGAPDAAVFSGTFAVRGQGTFEVTAIGSATRLGQIGRLLAKQEREPSPMERTIRRLVRRFAVLGLLLSAVLVAVQMAHGVGLLRALLAGLTLAIATIPEEFPVVLSVFLALGGWRMARQNAIVRRPSAIEAIGSTTVLCTDKTGTLTVGHMALHSVWLDDREHVLQPGVEPPPSARAIVETAALATATPTHDPMDRALLDRVSAQPAIVLRHYPFNAAIRLAASVTAQGSVACKGSPEAVLSLCDRDDALTSSVSQAMERLGAHGLRMLGVAEGYVAPGALPDSPASMSLHWLGLVAFEDPLRAEVPDAVQAAQAAGVRILLVTGDSIATACAIAQQAGIKPCDNALSGAAMRTLSDDDLLERLRLTSVIARVQPEDKLRLVRVLARSGEVVTMTGDGVNDAPALKAAHSGVSMGKRGTDVAREAASIVLADDNFATIVGAIAAGRRIQRNLRGAIRYIIAVHVPIVGVALLPVIAGGPMLLTPVHVLMLEMLIDPVSSLMFEQLPADAAIPRRAGAAAESPMMSLPSLVHAVLLGTGSLVGAALVYRWVHHLGSGVATTLAFFAIVAGNLSILAWSGPWLRTKQARKVFVLVTASVFAVLALLVGYLPLAHVLGFATVPIGWALLSALAAVAAVGAAGIATMAFRSALRRASVWRARASLS